MGTFGKLVAGGGLLLAGYLVGFYEMKYKAMKAAFDVMLTKTEEEKTKKEEEAQA